MAVTPDVRDFFQLQTQGSYVRNHELLEVDGILVDVDNIVRRRYRCDTSCCLHEAEGRQRQPDQGCLAGDCCWGPEVWMTEAERRGILAHLPGIVPFMAEKPRRELEARLRRLRRDPSRAFCRPVRVNGQPLGMAGLLHMPGGACIFRFEGAEDGRPYARCAIHAHLLQAGLPLWGIKPMTCWVWPLAPVPCYDGRMLLTLHTLDTRRFTGEGRYHASRPCLLIQPPDAPFVYQTCEPELRRLFGNPFYEHLLEAIAGV